MGLSKEKLHHVKESIKCGSFSKEWWTQLTKLIRRCDLTRQEKIMVYLQIARGLYIESISVAKTEEDYKFIVGQYEFLNEILVNELNARGYKYE